MSSITHHFAPPFRALHRSAALARRLAPLAQLSAYSPRRPMSSARNPLNRPAPPSLPREEQREFENLIRKAQAPLSQASVGREQAEAELAMHPDARAPLQAEFEGDTNPLTGEQGGPKREPVRQWAEGDWSFKGRVSDF